MAVNLKYLMFCHVISRNMPCKLGKNLGKNTTFTMTYLRGLETFSIVFKSLNLFGSIIKIHMSIGVKGNAYIRVSHDVL